MKKFLLLIFYAATLPAWALCSVDGESVCTLPESNPSGMPLFNQSSTGINQSATGVIPDNSLQPSNLNNSFGQSQNQNGIQMQGSLGCQFGNCNSKEGNNDFSENQ